MTDEDRAVFLAAADIIAANAGGPPLGTGIGVALCTATLQVTGKHSTEACRLRMDSLARSFGDDCRSLYDAIVNHPGLDWPAYIRMHAAP